jgi:hypothetical protein
MPFFHEIVTHARCPDGHLTIPLARWRRVLADLAMADSQMVAWLAHIDWAPDGSGLVDQASPRPLPSSRVAGHTLYATPFVFGYVAECGSTLSEPWLEASFLIDSAEIEPADALEVPQYLPGVAEAIWQVMRLCAWAFPESGVYFASEAQGEDSWKALHGLPNLLGLWAFDLALIPPPLIARYQAPPREFIATQVTEGLGIARLTSWLIPPWLEGQ